VQVSESHGQSCCRAHCKTARCPPSAALSGPCRRQPVPRAVVFPRPLQHVQVPGPSGVRTRRPAPRASVLPRKLQNVQVPAHRGHPTRRRIPRAAGVVQPLQHLSVPTTSCV
jgi:hypothetical protein